MLHMTQTLTIHTDGGARGNPGPAAIGVVIKEEGKLIHQFGETIGETTNNVAEYTAVIKALEWCKKRGNHPSSIHFFLDSLLVVQQLNGIYKIKDAKLRDLSFQIRILENEVGGVITYRAVRRELNKEADCMVNQALDQKNF